MTDRPVRWTRRQFSQLFAAAAASSLLVHAAPSQALTRHQQFAFVGSSPQGDPKQGTVRVYRISSGAWRETHAMEAASPAHLVMHPRLPVLYVLHDVSQWEHRPRGAVSAYRFDAATGRLAYAGTQPLSLSATNPRHAVVTAGGQALFVAAETGGVYNVLPINADGTLHPVSAIRKECGLQDGTRARTAAPRQMVEHADGSVSATDLGQETTTRFRISRDAITLLHRGSIDNGLCEAAKDVCRTDFGRLTAPRIAEDAMSFLLI